MVVLFFPSREGLGVCETRLVGEFFSYNVILSIAKDLNTSTSAFQILHYVQNDTLCSFSPL